MDVGAERLDGDRLDGDRLDGDRLRAGELGRVGRRVMVRTIRAEDDPAYRSAVERSRARLSAWNPVDPGDLRQHLAGQGPLHRTFLILALDPEEDQPVVGRVNVSNVVRGRFRSATVGYDAYDPYAGRGMFAEGLGLVVDLALADVDDGGLGLHRVEANVQPGNQASAGALRSLGFRHEGFSPSYLYLPDAAGDEAWRDHERYAVTVESWPAEPYAVPVARPLVVLADTHGEPGPQGLARAVAIELGLPHVDLDLLAAAGLSTVLDLVRSSPQGAVLAGPWSRAEHVTTLAGLRAGLPSAQLCDLGVPAAADGPITARTATRIALGLRSSAQQIDRIT